MTYHARDSRRAARLPPTTHDQATACSPSTSPASARSWPASSDDGGFGFAIAKALAEAGATICVGSWPPALGIFTKLLERGKMDESMRLGDGRKLEFERIYPLDAAFDTLADVPAEMRENKRYKEQGDFSIAGHDRAHPAGLRRPGARHRRAQPGQRARRSSRRWWTRAAQGYLAARRA